MNEMIESEDKTMICKNCGKQVPENAEVCTNCGKPILGAQNQSKKNNIKPTTPMKPDVNKKKKSSGAKIAVAIIAAVLTIAVLVGGTVLLIKHFKTDKPDDADINTSPTSQLADTPVSETKDPLKLYTPVLDMFYESISCKWENLDGKDDDKANDPDSVSYFFQDTVYLQNASLSEIGYYFEDINSDGTPELFISSFERAKNGDFYDIYTVSDGEIIHVNSCDNKTSQTLLADNYIIYHTRSHNALLTLEANTGRLIAKDLVWREFYTGKDDFSWHYVKDIYYDDWSADAGSAELISEDEAIEKFDSLPDSKPLVLTSFADYKAPEPTDKTEPSTSETSTQPSTQTPTEKTVVNTEQMYKNYVSANKNKFFAYEDYKTNAEPVYKFIDLDQDGTKEAVVTVKYSNVEAHVSEFVIVHILTAENGTVKCVFSSELAAASRLCEKIRIFKDTDSKIYIYRYWRDGSHSQIETVYTVSDGKLNVEYGLKGYYNEPSSFAIGTGKDAFTAENTEGFDAISEEEFSTYQENLENRGTTLYFSNDLLD